MKAPEIAALVRKLVSDGPARLFQNRAYHALIGLRDERRSRS
jgi:hypothetical protein